MDPSIFSYLGSFSGPIHFVTIMLLGIYAVVMLTSYFGMVSRSAAFDPDRQKNVTTKNRYSAGFPRRRCLCTGFR
jgi:hypothetical protein